MPTFGLVDEPQAEAARYPSTPSMGRRDRRRRPARRSGCGSSRRARRRRSRGPPRARSTCSRTKSSPSSSAATAPRCMKAATPEVEYWMRFSITPPSVGRRADPADAPAGHRPVLGEGVDEEDAVVLLHRRRRRRARARAVEDEAAVDLVGDDPEAALAGKREDGAKLVLGRRPAGRVGRRVDEDRARRRT